MIHIADLRPSDLMRLDERLSDPSYADEFMDALVGFLRDTPTDGGADSDLIYTTAVKLTNAKAWNHIDVSKLAKSLKKAPVEAVTIFGQGLPPKTANLLVYNLTEERTRSESVLSAALKELADLALANGSLTAVPTFPWDPGQGRPFVGNLLTTAIARSRQKTE